MRTVKLNKCAAAMVIVALALGALAGCQVTPTAQPEELIRIEELKGPEWERFVGETVTVEGIFVRDPVPMLVTDLDIVLANMAMPEDQYVVLVKGPVEEMNAEEYGGAKMRITGEAVLLQEEGESRQTYLAIAVVTYKMIERGILYDPRIYRFKIEPGMLLIRHWAVLFSGGINASNNRARYWNDLKFMYSTLVNEYGYDPNRIAVLYGNGTAEDTDMPVHYSATQANLTTVFNLLRQNTTSNDFIFVFTTNHGGGFEAADISFPLGTAYTGELDSNADEPGDTIQESTYNRDLNADGDKLDTVSWDEELCAWGGSIIDDSLQTITANLNYDTMVVVMEQCFSGGLIHDIAQGGSDRIIISAAGEYEPSWAMPPSYNYDEFSYYFTCAINGEDPDGNTVNADTNNDGRVSMVEAFNYARTHDTRSETPWYEDSGDGIPHSGAMPASGEGTLGGSTFLD